MVVRRLYVLLAIALGAASLLIPAVLVGHPNVFPDTSAYALVGQWFLEQAGVPTEGAYGYLHHRVDLSMFFTIAGARSPYYGVLLYLITDRGSAWAMAAVQALAASALVALMTRVTLGRFRLIDFAAVMAVMVLASTLPYFASFIMPDLFLGLGALAAILLLFHLDGLSRGERWALGAGLLLALLFHATNPPVIFVLVLAAGVAIWVKLLPGRPARGGLVLVTLAVVAGVAGGFLYPVAVRALSHHELSRPPFLSARLLADGPGRDYLRATCGKAPPLAPAKPFTLCRFRGLKMSDANTILWAPDKTRGVFEPSDYASRLALTHEEPRFVAAVVAAEPLRTAWLLVQDVYFELVDVSVLDTLGYSDRGLIARGPRVSVQIPGVQICVRKPNYCTTTAFQRDSQAVLRWTLIGATAYLAARLACGLPWVRAVLRLSPLAPRLAAVVCAVFVLLLANAAICGALSGVYARYQMRVAWLLPLMAVLAWLQASPIAAFALTRTARPPRAKAG
jgi:hypothetical protein